jgi:hypothetical protein
MSAHLEPLPIVLIGALLILHARLHNDRIGRYYARYEREEAEASVMSAEPSPTAPETTEASVAERSSARAAE